ncbi:MAG: GNAT family N-acetyltransferase [Acidimicrobiia bacterium]
MALPLPERALADELVGLRPWHEDDAAALAAAWDDPAIQRWTLVPGARSEDDARRWIGADRLRRERALSLDLVVTAAGDDATVIGEVGMVPLAGGPARAELGWWVMPGHRRRGVATRAVGLFATWLREELAFTELFAQVDPENPASIWVAESAGLRLRLK